MVWVCCIWLIKWTLIITFLALFPWQFFDRLCNLNKESQDNFFYNNVKLKQNIACKSIKKGFVRITILVIDIKSAVNYGHKAPFMVCSCHYPLDNVANSSFSSSVPWISFHCGESRTNHTCNQQSGRSVRAGHHRCCSADMTNPCSNQGQRHLEAPTSTLAYLFRIRK